MTNLKNKKLFRSIDNRILAGICGGIGEYFEVDPTLIRLILVVITLFGGCGVLLYIILWFIIPSQKIIHKKSKK